MRRNAKIAIGVAAGAGLLLLWSRRARAATASARVPCSNPAATCLGLENGAYARYEYAEPETLSAPTYIGCEDLDGAARPDVDCATAERDWPELGIPLFKRVLMGLGGRFVL